MERKRMITVVEVGPRDGFQNVKSQIVTEDKLAIIKEMIHAGIRQMEITSFVNPKWLPQMADAARIAERVMQDAPEGFRAIALAPNRRGVEHAVAAGLSNVTYVVSASESHNQKNVNRSIGKSLEELKEICTAYLGITIRVSLAVSFGCPFEGDVPLGQVLSVLEQIMDTGVREIVLCDTIGIANPLQVRSMVRQIKVQFPEAVLGLHIHDTRGMGLTNMYAGLLEGIDIFETSIGGLGGCPFAPGSAGNTATEDFLNMLDGMQMEHKIRLDRYLKAVDLTKRFVEAPLTGRLSSMCKLEAIS